MSSLRKKPMLTRRNFLASLLATVTAFFAGLLRVEGKEELDEYEPADMYFLPQKDTDGAYIPDELAQQFLGWLKADPPYSISCTIYIPPNVKWVSAAIEGVDTKKAAND